MSQLAWAKKAMDGDDDDDDSDNFNNDDGGEQVVAQNRETAEQ